MRVYRLERVTHDEPTRVGLGAWRAGLASKHDDQACSVGDGKLANRMPTPMEEPDGTPLARWYRNTGGYDHHVFGFASVQQYIGAFNSPTGREAIINEGFLSVYEVPDEAVLPGTAQVAFDGTKAKRVAKLPTTITEEYYG